MILSLHDDNIVVMNIKLFVGLGIVNCIYFNRGMNNYRLQIIGFMTQILIRKQKQKSVEEMILNAINNKKIPFHWGLKPCSSQNFKLEIGQVEQILRFHPDLRTAASGSGEWEKYSSITPLPYLRVTLYLFDLKTNGSRTTPAFWQNRSKV